MGGGAFCQSGSSPEFSDCEFEGNTADYGGGMYCQTYCSPILTRCSFRTNTAGFGFGGGIYCFEHCSPTLEDCLFEGNMSTYSRGGGMSVQEYSDPALLRCTFIHNAGRYGGGIHCYNYSRPVLTQCTFSENSAEQAGAGVYSKYYSGPMIINSVIAYGSTGEAVFCEEGGIATLSCCDVYGNAGGDWTGCIAAQYGINGNVSADPLFCGSLNLDEPLTLHSTSPCAPENSPVCGLIGAWGVGCGLTAVEPASWGAIKAMYR